MNDNKIYVEKYFNTEYKQYGFWIFMSYPDIGTTANKEKRKFIKFIESNLGPVGTKWQYHKLNFGKFILKLNSESDAVFFLLKFKKD